MDHQTKTLPLEAAIGISFQVQAGVGTLTFQTHVPQSYTKAQLDELVDKFEKVSARQAAKAAVLELEKHLKQQEAQLTNMRTDRARIDQTLVPAEGRRNIEKQTAELNVKRSQADANEKRMVEIITDIRTQLAECKAVIAGQ